MKLERLHQIHHITYIELRMTCYNVYRGQVHITLRKGELCQCRLEKSAQLVPPGASFLDESRECEVVQVGTQRTPP